MFHHLKSNHPESSCLACTIDAATPNSKNSKAQKHARPCFELDAAKAICAFPSSPGFDSRPPYNREGGVFLWSNSNLQIARCEYASSLQLAVAGSSPLALLEPGAPDVQKRDWLRVFLNLGPLGCAAKAKVCAILRRA
jgi:hypothetical protein